MGIDRREQLAEQLSEALRGLEDPAIQRIGRIFEAALRDTVARVLELIDKAADQPDYNPVNSPGAFLGSTPEGPVPIEPLQKNQAGLLLQAQLIQDLRVVINAVPLSPERLERLNGELRQLFDRAQDLGTNYGLQLIQADLAPAMAQLDPDGTIRQLPGQEAPPAAPASPALPGTAPQPPAGPLIGGGPSPAGGRPTAPAPAAGPTGPLASGGPGLGPDRQYQGGQRLTRLFDLSGAVVAAERDFKGLSENYRRERDLATDQHVAAAKHYYAKWWGEWGESVSFETSRQMAQGPDPKNLARNLRERIPTINEAFQNRAATIARTETLMASGEAQERCWRKLRVGFVQYMATLDERTCEFCAPRSGCIYYIGSVKSPIHPNCRCQETPVSLESLAIENDLADKPAERWEAQAQRHHKGTLAHFFRANGKGAKLRPVGGAGDERLTPRDYPLMERKQLPQSVPRQGLGGEDPLNLAARPWPTGDPVWCPRRGWLDPAAQAAYDAIVREVAEL